MCRFRLLLFWKTLLHSEQRYTRLCSRTLCLFRMVNPSGPLSRVSSAAASSWALSAGSFRSAQNDESTIYPAINNCLKLVCKLIRSLTFNPAAQHYSPKMRLLSLRTPECFFSPMLLAAAANMPGLRARAFLPWPCAFLAPSGAATFWLGPTSKGSSRSTGCTVTVFSSSRWISMLPGTNRGGV